MIHWTWFNKICVSKFINLFFYLVNSIVLQKECIAKGINIKGLSNRLTVLISFHLITQKGSFHGNPRWMIENWDTWRRSPWWDNVTKFLGQVYSMQFYDWLPPLGALIYIDQLLKERGREEEKMWEKFFTPA